MSCKLWLNRQQLIAIAEDLIEEGRGDDLVFNAYTWAIPLIVYLKWLKDKQVFPFPGMRVASVDIEPNIVLNWKTLDEFAALSAADGQSTT